MPHPVICSICKEKFDRDLIQAVKTGKRRYAHLSCCSQDHNYELVPLNENAIEQKKKDKDLAVLEEYIKSLFKDDWIYPRIKKQINKYVKEMGFTYYGILMALKYAYEIKQMDLEKAHGGIGIIEWIYKDSCQYWDLVEQSKESNKQVKLTNESNIVTVKYQEPQQMKIKLFDLEG